MARQNDWPRTIAVIYGSIYSTAIFITGVWSAWQVWQRQHEEESDTQKRTRQADNKEEEKEDQLVVADERKDNESGDQNKPQLGTAKGTQEGGGAGSSPVEQSRQADDVQAAESTDVNNDDKKEETEDGLVVADRRSANESGDESKLQLGTVKGAQEGGGAGISSGKESMDTGTSAGPSNCKLFASFVKLWWELFKGKTEMYLLLVPHVFDQATDAGAISEFFAATAAYGELTEEEKENTFDPTWFFRFSVFIFVFQRVVSSGMVYFMTNRNWKVSLQQIFDVLILKAIWVNYDLGLTEPCNPQLYIELLEATFESAPQLLLSTGYLLRQSTSGAQTGISTFIVVQVVFSLYSLSAKIASDDKAVFAEEYQDLVVKNDDSCCMKRSLNYKWFLRVVFWRFLEVTCRFCILLLIWFGMGGLSLCVVIAVEICLFSVYAFFRKRVDVLVNVLYLMVVNQIGWTWLSRIVSNLTFLVIATIFVAVRFEAVQVPEYSRRHDLFVKSNIGLAILIYAWIAQFIWPYFVFYFVEKEKIKEDKIATRSISEFGKADRPKEVLQLLKFGVLIDAKELLNDAALRGHSEVVKYLVDECNADCNQTDKNGKTPLHKAAENAHSEVVKYLVTEGNADCKQAVKDGETPLQLALRYGHTEVVKCMVEWGNADCNQADKNGRTPLHWAVGSGRTEVVKYLVEECNADCKQADKFGKTPLHLAAQWERTQVVKYLQSK